ncbi:MAG: hypothetical protein IT565_01340 [Rhodospirillales bacterium]|nr:hypothetical protein [Rhodospirillales bacterium]
MPPDTDAKKALSTQENLLLDYLYRLEKFRKGRQAVLVHLSKLQVQNRREQHVRAAASGFDPQVRKGEGQIFTLANTDIVFIYKAGSKDDTQAVITRLRFMFADDPLLMDEIPGKRELFCSWFDLDKDYDKIIALTKTLHAAEEQRRAKIEAESAARQQDSARGRGQPLTPELLGRVEDALSQADLSNLLRRQSVCALVGKAAPQKVSTELFVSIADLRETLIPDVNLASSPWLFQHMTETLDRRVLYLLSKHDDKTLTSDFSINLNVATLLSPEFMKFDDNVRSASRGTIVIELQRTDIFYDLNAYMFARDFVHERGYRICIDSLSHQALRYVNRQRLGADLLKLIWSPDMQAIAKGPERDKLAELILERGAARTILCRCDDQAAIEAGQALGLTLFQGRYVDSRLADTTQQGIRALRRR